MQTRNFLLGIIVALVVLSQIGCEDSNPVSTGFSGEGGYSINLGATSKSLPYGSRMALTATIRDSNGKLVEVSPYYVTFTSDLGGEFTPIQAVIASGVVSTLYVAPKALVSASIRAEITLPTGDSIPTTTALGTDLPKIETITASFLGSTSKLSIFLFKP